MTNLFSGMFIEGRNPVQIPSVCEVIKPCGIGVNLPQMWPMRRR